MNQRQFFEKLAETERDWSLCPKGEVRLHRGTLRCACPITAVANHVDSTFCDTDADRWVTAANRLDLDLNFAEQVATAADHPRRCRRTRRKLLQACGLGLHKRGDVE